MEPLVSVVITTKNEEKNIENCIKSILGQTYKKTEIIVVDNKSEDKTKERARRYTRFVFDKGPERSVQRNFGMINKARGKYVVFLDADMIMSPNLIRECVKLIEKEKCLALHIPEIVLGKSFFSRVRRFERGFYNGTSIDGARLFLKSAFVEAGGFDENFSGPEDWDIDKKIKKMGRILLLEAEERLENWEMSDFITARGAGKEEKCCIYHNEAEFNLKKYLSKKGYYAKSFGAYIQKWGRNDSEIKRQLGFYYRFLGVFVENGKWTRLVKHPILTCGMYFLRFLVGFAFIFGKKGSSDEVYKKS